VSDTLLEQSVAVRTLPPSLKVYVTMTGAECTLWLVGSLLGDSVYELQTQIDRLGSLEFETLLINCAELVEVDEVGSSVLSGIQHYAAGRGAGFLVQATPPCMAATLAQPGTDTTQ
jgi:hypothetical protein